MLENVLMSGIIKFPHQRTRKCSMSLKFWPPELCEEAIRWNVSLYRTTQTTQIIGRFVITNEWIPCYHASEVDHEWHQTVVKTKGAARCVTDVLTAFLGLLWSISVKTYGNTESLYFIWYKSKMLLMVMHMLCMSSSISRVKSNQNVCIIQLIILCVISHSSECQQGGCNLYLLPCFIMNLNHRIKSHFAVVINIWVALQFVNENTSKML